MKSIAKILLSVVVSVVAVACGPSTTKPTASQFKIFCDESVENILRQEVEVYEIKYPGVRISPVYTDERTILDSINAFKARVAFVPSELSDAQKRILKANDKNYYCVPMAVDAVAIIAHKDNPVIMLSVKQLGEILTGKVKDWNEISPSSMGEIKVVFDNEGSSTVRYMLEKVTGRKPFGKNIYAQKTNKEVFRAVQANKGAIGIIGVSWLSRDLSDIAKCHNYSQNEIDELEKAQLNHNIYSEELATDSVDYSKTIQVIPIRRNDSPYPYKPYQLDIYTGDYPLFRTIYAICTAPAGTPEHAFCRFITSIPGQKVLLNTGVLPSNMPPASSVNIVMDE